VIKYILQSRSFGARLKSLKLKAQGAKLLRGVKVQRGRGVKVYRKYNNSYFLPIT